MKTGSCKAKGRRACAELREALLRTFPRLQEDDIRVTPASVTGEDIQLSPAARQALPYVFECKNVEKLNIWDALRQAKSHSDKFEPILAFRKNNMPMYITMELESFLRLLKEKCTS